MKQATEKLFDLSMAYGLLNAVVKNAGLSGLCVVGPHFNRKKLKNLDILLEIKNLSDNKAVVLDGIDFKALISHASDINSFFQNEAVTGEISIPVNGQLQSVRYDAFPIVVNHVPKLVAIAFKSAQDFTGEDEYLIASALRLIGHSLILQTRVDELLISKTRYTRLFESAPEAIAMVDHDNYIIDVNPEFEHMFLYRREDIIGKKIDELIAPRHLLKEAMQFTKTNWEGGRIAVETQRIRHDGKLIDVSVLGVPFIEGDGNLCIYGIYRDISERKKSEKQKISRIAFIEYMSRLSSDLINMKIDEIDQNIRQAIETVARFFAAERSYLVMISDSLDSVKIIYEWTCDERFSHLSRQPVIYLNELPEYFSRLKSGQISNMQRTDHEVTDGPDNLAFFFDLLSIESVVHIPLFIDHEFKGFIGFDTFSRPEYWDEQVINSFKLTGQILINAQERRFKEVAIKDALQKAESSDKLKSAFLAGISHEVRTPMNHILGFIELMNEPYISTDERDEYLEIMKSSGMHLLRLIDDVIELAMIDSGQVGINETPCEISRFMESLLVEAEGVKAAMNRSGVALNLRIPPECRTLILNTDEIRLRQILWNLLMNAIKFTPRGKIEFGLNFTEFNRIEFYVSDTGIGIDENDLQVIFERFRRVENNFSRQFGGAGLGLSISQGLAFLFGSSIKVQSSKETGSIFSFSIPYVLHSQEPASRKKLNGEVRNYTWEGKSILMVEDDPVSMRFLTVLLLNTGANLFYASNGEEALLLLEEHKIDVVLMDMQMPVLDGYSATRIIKKRYPGIPVVAQTAHAMKDDKSDCFEAGCDDYIPKPIDKNSLYFKLEQLLNRKNR
ncbi:MAG: response regulator [Bacteroidales bacterium]|nr:response regulator [Bacteroidales bacterium]